MPAKLENLAVVTVLDKGSFYSNPKKSQFQKMFKPLHNCTQSHTLAKQCSKYPKPGFNSTWNVKFQMFKVDLEKAEELEIKRPTSTGSSKKAREIQKTIYFCFIDYAKAFDCVDHNKLENS